MNKSGNVTITTKEIQKKIRYYIANLYVIILEKMNILLNSFDFPRLNQDEVEYLNKFITIKKIKIVIKVFPQTRNPGTDESQ